MEHILCDEQKPHLSTGERKICELFNFYLVIPNLKALSDTSVLRSTTLLKYRNKPKFRSKNKYKYICDRSKTVASLKQTSISKKIMILYGRSPTHSSHSDMDLSFPIPVIGKVAISTPCCHSL